jgi:hypothetical protein
MGGNQEIHRKFSIFFGLFTGKTRVLNKIFEYVKRNDKG